MARPVVAAALLALCTGACSTEQHTTYVTAPPVSAGPVVEGVISRCSSWPSSRGLAIPMASRAARPTMTAAFRTSSLHAGRADWQAVNREWRRSQDRRHSLIFEG